MKLLQPRSRSVSFLNDATEYNIDIIMLCTGYEYQYPFLPKVEIANDGQQVANLWEHIFWIPDPTLSFVGLPKMSAIFTVAEAQSAYIARMLACRIPIPHRSIIQENTDDQFETCSAFAVNKRDAAKKFHNLQHPKDKEYINGLSE